MTSDPCECSICGLTISTNVTIIEGSELYSELRGWRLNYSNTQDPPVPAFVTASNRTLRDIAFFRPGNQLELLEIYGMGETRWINFGLEILELISRSECPEIEIQRICGDCGDGKVASGSPSPFDPQINSPAGGFSCPTCGRDWDGIRGAESTDSTEFTEPSEPGDPEILTNEILDLTPEQQRAIPKSSNVFQVEIRAKSLQLISQAIDDYIRQPSVGMVFDCDDYASPFTFAPEWISVRAGGVGFFRQKLAHTISRGGL